MAQCKSCGEEIDFVKTGEFKEDGKPRWKLVNPVTGAPHVCRGKQKPSSVGTPQILSGILLDILGGGVLIRTDAGDRTYPLPKNYTFSPRPELPQQIEYMLRTDGCLVIMKLAGPADVPLVKNEFKTATEIMADPDRLNGPANGEGFAPPGGQLIAPPQTAAADISASPSPAAKKEQVTVPVTTMHKERLIVLQSSLKAAVDLYFNLHGSDEDANEKAPAIVMEWAVFFSRGILKEAANPGE